MIARQVIDAGGPFGVTDRHGRLIGQIDRAAVLGVLVGDQPQPAMAVSDG
jgi:hypothetical protein